jgi:nicotinic acid mononucleotide adenylyltransferase
MSAIDNIFSETILLRTEAIQDISSTLIRHRLENGEAAVQLAKKKLISLEVATYIMKSGLYRPR